MAPKKQITQAEAVRDLYFEFTSKKRSKTALARLRRACAALGLDGHATQQAEYLADYRPFPDGDVYPAFV